MDSGVEWTTLLAVSSWYLRVVKITDGQLIKRTFPNVSSLMPLRIVHQLEGYRPVNSPKISPHYYFPLSRYDLETQSVSPWKDQLKPGSSYIDKFHRINFWAKMILKTVENSEIYFRFYIIYLKRNGRLNCEFSQSILDILRPRDYLCISNYAVAIKLRLSVETNLLVQVRRSDYQTHHTNLRKPCHLMDVGNQE